MTSDHGGHDGGAPSIDPWTGRPVGSPPEAPLHQPAGSAPAVPPVPPYAVAPPPGTQAPSPWAPGNGDGGAGQWQQPGQPGQWQQPGQPGQWQQPGQPGQWQQPGQPGQWQQPGLPPGGWQPPAGWAPPPGQHPPGWQPAVGPGGAPGWWAPEPIPDAYPVNVSFARRARYNRFWGIPIIGHALRVLVLIPHVIALPFVVFGVLLLSLFTWIPVLVSGRYPRVGYRWVGGLLRWTTRIAAWVMLLTPAYPPLSLESDEHPVRLRIDEGRPISRFWGIPLVGILIRTALLLPHWIALTVLGFLVSVLMLVSWIPVLFYRRQADAVYSLAGGYLRWYARVMAYQSLMASRYPPFTLGEDDPAPVW
jgi:hypothetical protein